MRLFGRRSARRAAAAELAGVRHLAEEDVVVFGEQLQRLDALARAHELGDEGRAELQTALDSYETAQRALDRLAEVDQARQVTDALTDGRYALACVRARIEGTPMPAMRAPCFFNPQHGPAATEVEWTTGRLGTRRVPACAQDAARVANRESPDVRRVPDGSSDVPYWESQGAYQPYRSGHYTADVSHIMRSLRPGG